MGRCKHANVVYIEFIECSTAWFVWNGKPESEGYHEPGNMMEAIRIKCQDCKLNRVYRTRKQQPAWVRRIAEQIAADPLDL
jgi:hypothetical protein